MHLGWMRLAVLAASSACLGTPACVVTSAVSEPPRQSVILHNPEAADLWLHRIGQRGDVPVSHLGTVATTSLLLPLGVYRLRASLAGVRDWDLPLPLHAEASRPPVVELWIAPPPPGDRDFVWVPAGPALIGDVVGVGQEDERPARVLDVPGFWIGRREVTNAEFAAFLNESGEVADRWLDLDSRKCRVQRGVDGRYATDAPDLPVVTISHPGALAFCEHRTRVTGRRHRLPSEIEWEKAARGPDSLLYAYGNVYCQVGANQESGRLRSVGEFPPNGFGLQDMTGNAFEWVADAYARDAYAGDAHAEGVAPADGGYRVLRGGSFVLDGMYLRNSMRMKLRPGVRADDVGFRVLIEAEAER